MESRKRRLRALPVRKAKRLTKRSRVDEDATPASEGTNVSRDTQPEADPEQQVDTAEIDTEDIDSEEIDSELELGEQGGEEGATAITDETDKQLEMKRGKVKGLYKPPTHSELQTLKETQNLFSSNLMKLQITELLSEVKLKQGSKKKAENFLHKLKEALTSLPSSDQIDLCDGLSLLSKKVCFPLKFDLMDAKGKFQFIAPRTIKMVGGLLLGTLSKPHPSVDLSVHIPVECLQAKDILNYRYFQKRALYLAVLARHLLKRRKSLGITSLEFTAHNPLLPTLVLTLEGSKVTVILHTSIENDEYFKRTKLTPDHNNVRRYYLNQLQNQFDEIKNQFDKVGDQSQEFAEDPPTPQYNGSVLLELGGREKHLVTLYSALHDSPGLVDAVLLCKVWARQRMLDQGPGRLSGFHFSLLIAWLCDQKKLNAHMSSYQAFRVIMQTFVASDWTLNGISMTQMSLDVYHRVYDVVFIDESGLNIFAELSKDRYRWIQHEASLALRNLDNQTTNGFQALFMTSITPRLKFDILCRFPAHQLSPTALVEDNREKEALLLDSGGWPLPQLIKRVLPFLEHGLDKRVKLLTLLPWPSQQWSLSESPPAPHNDITIALLLDTDYSFSTLEVGPPSDSNEAAVFREFWGEKAQLRRFKDGSIREAIVWVESGSVASQRTIPTLIIGHLLERHAGLHGDCVSSQISCMDPLISLPSYSKNGSCSTGEELGSGVVSVFTALGRELRQLGDLPLSITSVQGTGPAFRHTQVFPHHPWNGRLASKYTSPSDEASQPNCYYPSCDVATPPFVPVYNVVCQMESSGKWPEDIEAIAKIKTSFYTYISKALKEKYNLLSSPTVQYLDILKEGYVFRVKIHYHRELLLLKDAVTKATGLEEARLKRKLVEIQRELVSMPLLTSWLNGVQGQHAVFASGARLCKRWVSAQLLTNHLSDEAVELMVAYLFLHPSPYTPPAVPLTVFLRFLSLIVSFDWISEPLIVNFNNELSDSAISEMLTKFSSTRSSLPSMVITTPTDHTQWNTPSPPVFTRLQLLARESLVILINQKNDIKQVFRPPLDDYHVIIHLHKRHVPRYEQAVDAMATNFDPAVHYKHKCTHLPVVDFDPVEKYVHTLEMSYADYALFFYDQYGGSYIAIAWKPSAFTPQPFKVMQMRCHVRKNKGMVPDSVAMVTDFELLGEGLVKNVEVISYTPS